MNFLDIIIVVSIAVGFFIGWKLRAINLFCMVISLVAGILVANHFHPQLLGLFRDLPTAVSHTLAWLTAFLATAVTISIIGGIISKAFELIRLKWLDHLLGAVLAITLMLGLLIISLTIIDNLARTYRWKIIEHSVLSPVLLKIARPLISQGIDKIPRLNNFLK
ncbi:CvpA family protein [bacterium]|nr:CvpA family protein [bacterium]